MNTTTTTVTEIHCTECGCSVSAAHVSGSYTCLRAAGVAPADIPESVPFR